jgi:hypothetical protein
MVRSSRRDLDPRCGTVHHLQRQIHGRVGQFGAVGDHDNPHHLSVALARELVGQGVEEQRHGGGTRIHVPGAALT